MNSPFNIVRDFEDAVAAYTGAPYAVAVTSCSMGLFLCLQWFKAGDQLPAEVEVPKLTYVSVPMGILNAGAKPTFRDEDWQGVYQLKPLPIWDAARRFTGQMYPQLGNASAFMVTSHHWTKILGISQGGVILHSNGPADRWLRRARFDGRTEGTAPINDIFDQWGWHCYMSPEVAAEGLVRLYNLPRYNPDQKRDHYPDLSQAPIFK